MVIGAMDEGELRRKRLRVFSPSQPERHQRTTDQVYHEQSPSRPAKPTSEIDTMPFAMPTQLRTITDSVATKFIGKGKRKAVEIVDLTSGPEPDPPSYPRNPAADDEELARRLQYRRSSFPSEDFGLPLSTGTGNAADDERYARQLQAELDGENAAPASRNGPTDTDDEAYARQLQAEYEEEHAAAINLPPLHPDKQQVASALDPHASRRTLQTFAEAVRHTACAGCGKPCLSSESDVILKFKQWFESSGAPIVSPDFVCCKGMCNATTCMGCGVKSTNAKHSVKLNDGCQISWCCARGRMILIWIVVCGSDRRRTSKQRRDSYSTSPKKKSCSSSSGAGVGYGGDRFYSHQKPKAPVSINGGKYGTYMPGGTSVYTGPVAQDGPALSEAAEEAITSRVMACLNVLLPSLLADSDFDRDPPNVLGAALTQSNILSKLAELLRNDSLEDATKRMPLYQDALGVVEKLGSHYATANATIHQTRKIQEGGPDRLSLSFASTKNNKDAKFEETQSLASCLRKLDKQSNAMLASSRAQPQSFADADSIKMLSLCQRVSDIADFLLANAAPRELEQPGQSAASQEDDWQSEMAVLEIEDDEILSRHYYSKEAAKAQNQALNRTKALSLQLTNLTSSLPPGIFVRHGSSRLDVMKVLIVGPKGTPYENGLFEFDLFCPSTFPNSPPSMNLRTTGGGIVRFNPNRYNCGKVCLSLLGTWAGEPWQAGKSTILQVLVSIQAMIFCDEPWYNEPGRGNPGKNNSASMAHNRELQGHTVRHAMLNWLQGQHDPVWGDIVHKHFAVNASAIERTVNGWQIDQNLKGQLRSALQRPGRSWR